ncbi:MAG: butyrate kinase [Syntrophales bacterium]|nr:butyrate kinase [Syntrophales bacterium]
MGNEEYLFVVNVGSLSTKVAFFHGSKPECSKNISYRVEDFARCSSLEEQLPRREQDVMNFLAENRIDTKELTMVVSRGGLGRPGPAGAYKIDEIMCKDLLAGKYGKHASALGPTMALKISRQYGVPAVVIDPPSTDEFEPLARISGIPDIERKSAFHALNQKMAARRYAAQLMKKYEGINVVVAHLGGGVTVGAHRKGRVIDSTHGLSEGPFTPERTGALPTMELIDLVFSGKLDKKQIQTKLVGQGGLAAYLGSTEAREVENMISGADEKAKLIYEAMAYQISKEIGAMASVLKGDVDGIIITGGLAHSRMLLDWIIERVGFLAPVFVYPGEDEMAALAEGGLRVLRNQEKLKIYGQERS